jgi:glycerol-3-phosphate dehydrogenase (NAD(P)+)
MNTTKIAVIGAGKWGSALQFALSDKQNCLIANRTKKDIKNFVSLDEALKCDYLVISISTQHIRQWLKEKFVFQGQKILVASKGIEASSGKFLKEIYEEFIPSQNLSFISGPSFASEVQKALPTALVINSLNKQLYDEFSLFFPDFIKTYYSTDVIGAEIAGAYKNVLAIASGICDGLNLGENARASLISRGLVEMSRFGKFYGSKDESFLGLSGAGDLFLTASSILSRNFRVGLGLAKNKKLNIILDELGEVAEGVATSEAIYNLAQKNNIYTPVANEVKYMLNGKNPKLSLKDLLSKSN